MSTGSGETEIFNFDEGAYATSSSYAVQTTASSQTMDWTVGSDYWSAVGATFKEATAGVVAGFMTTNRGYWG